MIGQLKKKKKKKKKLPYFGCSLVVPVLTIAQLVEHRTYFTLVALGTAATAYLSWYKATFSSPMVSKAKKTYFCCSCWLGQLLHFLEMVSGWTLEWPSGLEHMGVGNSHQTQKCKLPWCVPFDNDEFDQSRIGKSGH